MVQKHEHGLEVKAALVAVAATLKMVAKVGPIPCQVAGVEILMAHEEPAVRLLHDADSM